LYPLELQEGGRPQEKGKESKVLFQGMVEDKLREGPK